MDVAANEPAMPADNGFAVRPITAASVGGSIGGGEGATMLKHAPCAAAASVGARQTVGVARVALRRCGQRLFGLLFDGVFSGRDDIHGLRLRMDMHRVRVACMRLRCLWQCEQRGQKDREADQLRAKLASRHRAVISTGKGTGDCENLLEGATLSSN